MVKFSKEFSNVIISVSDLVKQYDTLIAVKNINFEVYEGEIFGLLGPNGAGKTTTLEIIETLKIKTSGTVIVDGFNIDTEASRIKHIIGIQLQSAGFSPNLTLLELIELFSGLYCYDVDGKDLLGKFGLLDKKKSKYKALSGGQKQRFSICTTLINQPKIIFLDEPTTGLDPQARRNLWELIKAIRQNGTTIVLTTHYLDEAEYLCDRVGIMDNGVLIALDSPDNLIEQLIKKGFVREKPQRSANLEDVFLDLTGKELRIE